MVDTRKRDQLKEFDFLLKKQPEIVVYDHHPSTSYDLPEMILHYFPFGANTTGAFQADSGTGDATGATGSHDSAPGYLCGYRQPDLSGNHA